jgi:hypothetical protein
MLESFFLARRKPQHCEWAQGLSNVIHVFFLMAGALDAGKKWIDEVAAALAAAFKGAPMPASVAQAVHAHV